MLPQRFIRVTALMLIILMAAAVILGYDYHHDAYITDACFVLCF